MFSTSYSRVQYVPGLYDCPEDELLAAGDYLLEDLAFVVQTNREYRVCPFTNERYYMYRPAGGR